MRKCNFTEYRYPVFLLNLVIVLTASVAVRAQVDDICREFGFIATLEGPRLSAPFIFGRINVKAYEPRDKFPKINITYQNRGSSPERLTVGRSGNYCFKMGTGSGGILIVEVDGVEVARRQVATLAPAQQREDFDVLIDREERSAAPGVVPSKPQRPPNPKTADLYKKASEAESAKDTDGAIRNLKEIVELDAEDFVGWGLLANKLLAKKDYAGAEAALRKAVALKEDHFPAWMTAGRIRAEQKQHEAAIEVFKHAIALEPTSAQAYQLLGESYLQTKQGTLGADALNKAIELDPVGMAELHLQLAHLYRLAKANKMAADEYRKFLAKVPDHPDERKFEKFIADNPPK
ncbi:MAG: tetratricopeptide repeat protein [Chloracidobacterium sp.]|nr:tetratricopeptide repeat protein [Chloracidobacterium sp.]